MKKKLEQLFVDEDDKINSRKIYDTYLKTEEKFYSDYSDIYNNIFLNKVGDFLKGISIDVNISLYGGYNGFERGCVVFTPVGVEEVNPFSYLTIETNKFQNPLKHKDVLGSLLGLGIKRNKIGDILFFESKCYIVVLKDIEEFVLDNLTQIGRQKIKVVSCQNIEEFNTKELESVRISLSSLRLDNFIAGVTNLSRNKVKELIEKERVFLNHNICLNHSKEISINDIVTIRGYGRFYYKENFGVSKKGKIQIRYEK
ncbi:MAG: YlmH/Sll1252 family protein [Lachnospirales bacterium]